MDHVARTRQIIDANRATCRDQEPPLLILNRHCAVCDFQPRCRGLAIERDDLSLLTAMTGKERAKFNAKGNPHDNATVLRLPPATAQTHQT